MDSTEGHRAEITAALNKISGQWDEELLARMIADLTALEEIDLSLSGFGEDELGKLLKRLDSRERRECPYTFDCLVVLSQVANGLHHNAAVDLVVLHYLLHEIEAL